MKEKLTILVNSCDKYEDAWEPFFACLKHFSGERQLYPIVLNTESKQFQSDYYHVDTINTPGKATWSKRLKNVLSFIDTEYVFFLLEDYFLEDTFDNDRLEKVIQYMDENRDVGIVDIRPRWAESRAEAESNKIKYKDVEDSFEERNLDRFNITCSPAIWRVSALKSLLRSHEDVWQFEYYSGIRAKKYGVKVVRFVTRVPGIYEYNYQIWSGMGITQGQWLPGNVDFFAKLNIPVNFEKLGILDVASMDDVRKHNRSSLKNVIKKIPTKIKKRMTRRLSLK